LDRGFGAVTFVGAGSFLAAVAATAAWVPALGAIRMGPIIGPEAGLTPGRCSMMADMEVPIGSDGWYLCDDQDQPEDDFVEFLGHEAHTTQFLNQFRDNVFAQQTFRRLLGATHPFADEDSVPQDVALRIGRGTWLVRQPTFQLYPSGGKPAAAEAPAFPKEERSAGPSSPAGDPPVFPSDIDPAAIAQAQKDAAAAGVPFCEECVKAALAQQAQ